MPEPDTGCVVALRFKALVRNTGIRLAAGGLALLTACAAPTDAASPPSLPTPRQQRRLPMRNDSWTRALNTSIDEIERYGPGGYATDNAALTAFINSFRRDERSGRLRFNAAGARPSFCSSAVYAAMLSALIRWDEKRGAISAAAWEALRPKRAGDGVGPWGYANANGPGFALLVHELGAGISFTEVSRAQTWDVLKLWWTDAIGLTENGHLAMFVRDEGDSIRIWSSNMPLDGASNGYGFKSVPKRRIKHMLFTRITHPEAFAKASAIGKSDWLASLLRRNVTWEECCRKCAVPIERGSRRGDRAAMSQTSRRDAPDKNRFPR